MKKMLKIAIIVILVILILIPIVPYRIDMYKDGGSRVFTSLTYEICRYHKLVDSNGIGYFNGWRIEILGKIVRDDAENFVP